MATFASSPSSSSLFSLNFLQEPAKSVPTRLPKLKFLFKKTEPLSLKSPLPRLNVVASVATADPSSPAARRLYVGNIPRTVSNDELQKIFEEHGNVEKAEVMYDKYSGRSRRFGFVTMNTSDDANAAAKKLNDTVS